MLFIEGLKRETAVVVALIGQFQVRSFQSKTPTNDR